MTFAPYGDDPLEPEAPTIVKNIAWLLRYGQRYWQIVLLASLTFLLSIAYKPILGFLRTDPPIPKIDTTTPESSPEQPSVGSSPGGLDVSLTEPLQPPPPQRSPISALECQLTAVQPRCALGDTGLRVFITFHDQPKRAKIELSGTASGTVSETIFAGSAGILDIENRRGELYLLDVAYREEPKTVEVTLGESPS